MKFIIHNEAAISNVKAVELVASVISNGLISNFGKSFCYATVFITSKTTGEKTAVWAKRNSPNSHTFTIRAQSANNRAIDRTHQ